ncbi:MAG: riboflavin kinase [Mycoplasmoidaceae bacterium]
MQVKVINTQTVKPSSLPLVIGYFGCIHVMHGQLFTMYHHYNVLTFKDMTSKVGTQIYPYKDRIRNIAEFKPRNIFIYDIAKNNMKAEEFIQKILLKINPSSIIVGTDFTFGSDHQSYEILKKYFKVEAMHYNSRVSTTIIADLLKNKDMEKANGLMFFPFYYNSKWITGLGRGKTIGCRTINLAIDYPVYVPEGCYVSKIKLAGRTFRSVTFYGKSPVFHAEKPTLETHVIGTTIPPRFFFPRMIKDNVKVEFLKYIREPKTFASKEELIKAIKDDIKEAKEYFEQNK